MTLDVNRRRLLVLLAAAAPGRAFADDAHESLESAFPLLDHYLALPPGERSRFYLAYHTTRDKRPVAGARGVIVEANGARIPLALDRQGQVLRLPTLVELKSGAQLEMAGAPFKLTPELRCTMAPAVRIDVAQITLALAQVNAAILKIGGALGALAPKFTAAVFPGAGAGQAVTADGRATPLPVFNAPVFGAVIYFEPDKLADARTVLLARAPSRIVLAVHPKPA